MSTICNGKQSGISSFAMIAAFVGLGVVFLTIFFISNSSPKVATKTPTTTGTPTPTPTATVKEPPFIRVPENSRSYANDTYKFMFSYPDSFGELTDGAGSGTVLFRSESALATNKPVGNSGKTVMNGRFGAYVYKKTDFQIVIQLPDVSVGATKTGSDTTWKIVNRGTTSQDFTVGKSYPVRSVKSQTGIPVFDFALKSNNTVLDRWVFESGDNFILIAMPTVSKTDNTPLTDADLAAYNVIGANLASTVRTPSTISTPAATSTDSSQTSPTPSPSPTSSTAGN